MPARLTRRRARYETPEVVAVDADWYRDVNDFARRTGWLHAFMAAYALWAGLVALVLLLLWGWLWARRQPAAPRLVATAFLTGVSAVAAVLANQQLLSPAIARARPCRTLPHVEVLLSCANDYSMPSDHCMIAGAFVAGLWVLHRRLGAVAAAFAVLLAFGRVYAGVHYPSDTVVGLVVGGVIGLLIVIGLRGVLTAVAERLAQTPLRAVISAPSQPGSEPASVSTTGAP